MLKEFTNKLKKKSPKFLKDYVKGFRKKIKNKELDKKAKSNQIISKHTIITDLQKLGLSKGDSVLVHSSLSKIGFVEGGPVTVIDALREVVGEKGTILFPTFPNNTDTRTYISENVFDIKNTPSKMGKITEVFRNMPETFRSFHPTHPVAAQGPLAEYYTKDHFGNLTPFNDKSPFYRLSEKKGKILMLGVSLDYLTNLHTLEDAVDFKYPVYIDEIVKAKMIDNNGNEVVMDTKIHSPSYSVKRKCTDLTPIFEKADVLVSGLVGEGNSMLIDAFKLHEFMVKSYNENGVTMYTPSGS